MSLMADASEKSDDVSDALPASASTICLPSRLTTSEAIDWYTATAGLSKRAAVRVTGKDRELPSEEFVLLPRLAVAQLMVSCT